MIGPMRKPVILPLVMAVFMVLTISLPPVLFAVTQKAERKQAEPPGVETLPDEGRRHLEPGERWKYKTNPPTSGPHDPQWAEPGFYSKRQRPEQLVHSMEHGVVIIYYDRPGARVVSTLKDWAKRYTGEWDGVIVTPMPGLGYGIILTAWQKRLRLDRFDPQLAQAFLDCFRGRGPESEKKMGCD